MFLICYEIPKKNLFEELLLVYPAERILGDYVQ